jgi:cytidine deaminase
MDYKELLAKAREAAGKAYAPYSGFKVGAALLTAEGKVITGSNIENVSYGLSICAERVAFFTAVAAGEKNFQAIAVTADARATPCGACRQVMAEFAPEALVITEGEDGAMEVKKVAELLPDAFAFKKSSS